MLQPRVIPVLLFQNDSIVKTRKFSKPEYIGDPINTVNLYNDFEVDELIILDIDASHSRNKINYTLIERMCAETFMPLTYGGGINSLQEMKFIFKLGIEKVVLGKSAYFNKELIRSAADTYGCQAIVASVDYRKSLFNKYNAYVYNGNIKVRMPIEEYIELLISQGCGEILLNAIDRDGMMNGYDCEFVKKISENVSVPVIALGGAQSRTCIPKIINYSGASAAAASSIFIYQNQEKGVLINFPEKEEIIDLLKE